jgi:hypothetical protein
VSSPLRLTPEDDPSLRSVADSITLPAVCPDVRRHFPHVE